MRNRLQRRADVAEQLADLVATGGHAPLGKYTCASVANSSRIEPPLDVTPAVVERLEVLDRDRLALFVGHGLLCQCHRGLLIVVSRAWRQRARSGNAGARVADASGLQNFTGISGASPFWIS